MGWVMVEEDESAHPGQLREGNCLRDRAVTPANRPRGPKERGKEAETLDMVHVEMRQEDVHALDGRVNGGPEPADAGSGVEPKDGAVGADDLDRGGVAPIPRRFRAGAGERPASPPQA